MLLIYDVNNILSSVLLSVSLNNIIASSVSDPLTAPCSSIPVQTSRDTGSTGTTSAAPSSGVDANVTGVPM